MKLTFIGDGDHAICTAFGLDFPVDEPVEVEADHPAAALADNPMFTVDKPKRAAKADA